MWLGSGVAVGGGGVTGVAVGACVGAVVLVGAGVAVGGCVGTGMAVGGGVAVVACAGVTAAVGAEVAVWLGIGVRDTVGTRVAELNGAGVGGNTVAVALNGAAVAVEVGRLTVLLVCVGVGKIEEGVVGATVGDKAVLLKLSVGVVPDESITGLVGSSGLVATEGSAIMEVGVTCGSGAVTGKRLGAAASSISL